MFGVPAVLSALPSVPSTALEPNWKQAHLPSLVNWCCWFFPSGVVEFSLPRCGPHSNEGLLGERVLEEWWHSDLPIKPS